MVTIVCMSVCLYVCMYVCMYVVGECSLLPAVNYRSVVEPAVGNDAHMMMIV